MPQHELNALGQSDMKLAGLRLWVHGRQFPDSVDYWDGNWLRVAAVCEYPGARVSVDGPFMHLGEIRDFLAGIEQLHATLQGSAKLDCVEPNLKIELAMDKRGHVRVAITITPDHLRQAHSFFDEVDRVIFRELSRSATRS